MKLLFAVAILISFISVDRDFRYKCDYPVVTYLFVFYSVWVGLTSELTKTVTETSASCGKEAQMKVGKKIIGGPCVN